MNLNWRTFLLGTGTVSRSTYLAWGLGLALLKYNVDRFALRLSGESLAWSLFEPQVLGAYLFQVLPVQDAGNLVAMLALSLPFVWAGVMLTVARLRSAGLRPWVAGFFFVPALKFVFFAMLCALPARDASPAPAPATAAMPWPIRWLPRGRTVSALVAAAFTAALGVGLCALSTLWMKDYGWSLFVATPFVVGLLAVMLQGLRHPDLTSASAVGAALLANAFVGLLLLGIALEGVFCLVMASPIAAVLGGLGGLVGYAAVKAVRPRDQGGLYCAAVLALPLLMAGEHLAAVPAPLLKVATAVEVDAPPEKIWPNVVTFSELPPATEWLFRAGIAYPVRARIEGRGPGAIRHCEFTTGPFVEPIEIWDEPRLLKFSVTANPEPMQEWTPYRDIHPPHLEGFLVSKRGQFLLERLPDGRTRLEGTTWYQHNLWPAAYWQVWSDAIIHTIHRRVLNHVKVLSETPNPATP